MDVVLATVDLFLADVGLHYIPPAVTDNVLAAVVLHPFALAAIGLALAVVN